jgi:hypothetical protein
MQERKEMTRMKIEIGNYVITSDPMNVILNEKYEKKDKEGEPTGEHGLRSVGFHRNLENACEALMNREIKISDAENLAELVEFIHRTKRVIVNEIQKLQKTEEK